LATPFQNVYDKFLESISDTLFAKLSQDDLEEMLFNYLDRSVSLEFKKCKKDLTKIDKILQQFEEDLTSEEEWIIALGMVLSYLSIKIKHENLLRTSVGDRDFKESSNYLTLNTLLKLQTDTKNELKMYKNSYTYNKFEGLS
jgi:hypothetical protein